MANHAGYSVILEKDLSEEDSKKVMDALTMIKGVLEVKPIVTSALEEAVAETRLRHQYFQKMQDVFFPSIIHK
jgi:hypothetical protein